MGIQISQCCSAKKNAVNEETLKKKQRKAYPIKEQVTQHKEVSVKSNQSSEKTVINGQLIEQPHEQPRSEQENNIKNNEDYFSNRQLLQGQQQLNDQKQEKYIQSPRINEEIQQHNSDIDEQRDEIDDFNRGLIFADEVNNNQASANESQQPSQSKIIQLDKVNIKSNVYRKNFEDFQMNALDQLLSGQKELKEFEEEYNTDSGDDENKGLSHKKIGGSHYNIKGGDDESQNGKKDDEEDDDDDEDEEGDNTDEESYDLFDSGGVLQRIVRENRKSQKKNGMGIDSHSAQRIKNIELAYDHSFCQTHAIRKEKDEGLLIVQNHEKGGSLSTFLDTAFNMKEAKVWMIKILQALQILHDNKLVHGNLKPNNILLGQGQLKLTDMNIFKNKKHLHSLYSAPEVNLKQQINRNQQTFKKLLKRDQLTEKSDIWSACIIFIEMRTGIHPFIHKDPQMTVEKLTNTVERMGLAFELDKETEDFIKMMYNLDPNKRSTAKELLNSRYLKSENNVDKQYLTSFQKKNTLNQKKLNTTKNYENSMLLSKQTYDLQMQKSLNHHELAISSKHQYQKGTTINIDKINDKGTKQYGVTSVLTVVNIKERDLQQQESYLPISVANLMTTQLTNIGNHSQQISNKDENSQAIPPNPNTDGVNHKKSTEFVKSKEDQKQQQGDSYPSTAATSYNKQQFTTMKTTQEQQEENDEQKKRFLSQKESYLQIIQQQKDQDLQNDDEDDDEDDVDDDDEDDEEGTHNQNNKTANQNSKLKSTHSKTNSQKKSRDPSNKSQQQLSPKKEDSKIKYPTNEVIMDDEEENEETKKLKEQQKIEQQLLDILNGMGNILDGGNSYVSDTSQDLKNSFVPGNVKRTSFQDLSLVNSSKIPSNMKFGSNKVADKIVKGVDQHEDINQVSSGNMLSPENQGLKSSPTKTADQIQEEMYRILNEGATAFSHDSLDDLKRQISTQNFVGLRKMLTISSQQKTSNSLKTQRTLGNSQVNHKIRISKPDNNVIGKDEKSPILYTDEDRFFAINNYNKPSSVTELKKQLSKTKEVLKNNSQINNFTGNSDSHQNDDQDSEDRRIKQQQELEQKLLDIMNQNGDADQSASFLQGSQEFDNKSSDRSPKEGRYEPLNFSHHLTHKSSFQIYQNSNNSLSQQKLKTQGTVLAKTPEQIADEMNRILNENASAFSIDSYEEIKRQISTQNFNQLRRTLTNNQQQRTFNSLKTQKTLQSSQITTKNNNSQINGKKLRVDPPQE